MLEDLAKSKITSLDVSLFASEKSAGTKVTFRGKSLKVQAFNLEIFPKIDFCLMSAGSAFSQEYSPRLVEAGCFVIDNSSAWRMDPKVPLIIPEVNGTLLKGLKRPTLIANPNCSTIQMLVAVAPLKQAFGLEEIQVATYQSASGAGQKGVEALSKQLKQYANQEAIEVLPPLPRRLAGSLIPAIDVLTSDGHCKEEIKMIEESRKILAMPDLDVFATTVRVPVERGHSEAIHLRLSQKVTRAEVIEVWKKAAGIRFFESLSYENLPCPEDVLGSADVLVGRVRLGYKQERSQSVQFWNLADNLKKGAASNAVQILEKLV